WICSEAAISSCCLRMFVLLSLFISRAHGAAGAALPCVAAEPFRSRSKAQSRLKEILLTFWFRTVSPRAAISRYRCFIVGSDRFLLCPGLMLGPVEHFRRTDR